MAAVPFELFATHLALRGLTCEVLGAASLDEVGKKQELELQ